MQKTIEYFELESFKKDFKKLQKRFPTLPDDFARAKKDAIELFHLSKINNQSVVLIPGFPYEKFKIYKLRKFACKSLKGKGIYSGIRIIYAYDQENKTVTFIEIYFKSDQLNEDRNRIESFIGSLIIQSNTKFNGEKV